jgi:hypothetical protein
MVGEPDQTGQRGRRARHTATQQLHRSHRRATGAHGPSLVRTMIRVADAGTSPTMVDDQPGQRIWTADVAQQIHALTVGAHPSAPATPPAVGGPFGSGWLPRCFGLCWPSIQLWRDALHQESLPSFLNQERSKIDALNPLCEGISSYFPTCDVLLTFLLATIRSTSTPRVNQTFKRDVIIVCPDWRHSHAGDFVGELIGV